VAFLASIPVMPMRGERSIAGSPRGAPAFVRFDNGPEFIALAVA
jgi:hypothetical protein